MKKKFLVSYFHTSNPETIYRGEFIFENEDDVKKYIYSNGYVIKDNIKEIAFEGGMWERMNNLFNKYFSTDMKYNPEMEIMFLKSFATAIKYGGGKVSDIEALQNAKTEFSRSAKGPRMIVDELIELRQKPGIGGIYDVFKEKPTFFSPDLLTLMKSIYKERISVDMVKILSNTPKNEDGVFEIEGYCELTERIQTLRSSIINKIQGPIAYFTILSISAFAILVYGVPMYLEAMSKTRDTSGDSYTFIGNSVIAISNFLLAYGIYFVILIVGALGLMTVLYSINYSFKYQVHRFLLKFPVIGDIVTLFYTRKITSLMAIFYKSNMRDIDIFDAIIPSINLLPLQDEMKYLREGRKSRTYDVIFKSYSDDDKYLTEKFYIQLAKESNSQASVSGRFEMAYAEILRNTLSMWENSLSKYPDKILFWVKFFGYAICGYSVVGIALIYIMTIVNTGNNL